MTVLRDRALALFHEACRAADPALALSRALAAHPPPDPGAGGGRIVIAVGKAAMPMARAFLAWRPDPPLRMIVVTNPENAAPLPGAEVMAAGHPVPDENGARAARAVMAQLALAGPADRVVALVSGGGSALLPAPVAGVSLQDKAKTSRLLLGAGLDIGQMNLVRQALSRLKGGGFLRLADPAPVTAYILSDVIGDDLRVIASGLTTAPVGNAAAARRLVQAAGLWPRLPASVRDALDRPGLDWPAPDLPLPPATNHLIGSNRKSLDAVVAAAGPGARLLSDALTGDVADAAAEIVAAAGRAGPGACLVFGGETTVTLRGAGQGGRNQELALRVALAMADRGGDWVFLSGGTDGRDGPTPAAGGLVDGGTIARMRAAGGDPAALLAENDSHHALALSGDLLITGPTGTNVADVQILLTGG